MSELIGAPVTMNRSESVYDMLVAAGDTPDFPRPASAAWRAATLATIATVAACTYGLPRAHALLGDLLPQRTAAILGDSSAALAGAAHARRRCAYGEALWFTRRAAEREPWPHTLAHARLVAAYVDADDCDLAHEVRTYLDRMVAAGAAWSPNDLADADAALDRCMD